MGGLCLVFAYASGILAMQWTTIAGAVVLFAIAPFFAAVMWLIFLGERVRRSTWALMAVALFGIAATQGGTVSGAGLVGGAFAMASAFFFAVFTIILRWRRDTGMLACVFLYGPLAAMISAGCVVVQGATLLIDQNAILIAGAMGVFQTGAGLVLYTIGSRLLPAVQLALLSLLEVVLSLLWVALFLGEGQRSG